MADNNSNPNSRHGSIASTASSGKSDDFDNIPGGGHDCANHTILPATDADGFCPLYPFSFRGWQLLGRSRAIRHMNRTLHQRQLEHSFLHSYFEADIDKLSDYRLYSLIWGWMEKLDFYFFGRTLTENEEPILDLTIKEAAPYHARFRVGITSPFFRLFPDQLKCFTTIYRSANGVRRTKLEILETCIHELTHTYLETFYDRCPAENNDPVYLKGPDHDGHGELFYSVFEETLARVRGWHAELALLGVNHRAPLPPPTVKERILDGYMALLGTNSWLQLQWDADANFVRTRDPVLWPVDINLRRRYDHQYENFVHDQRKDLMTIFTTDAILILIAVSIVMSIMLFLLLYPLVLSIYLPYLR